MLICIKLPYSKSTVSIQSNKIFRRKQNVDIHSTSNIIWKSLRLSIALGAEICIYKFKHNIFVSHNSISTSLKGRTYQQLTHIDQKIILNFN